MPRRQKRSCKSKQWQVAQWSVDQYRQHHHPHHHRPRADFDMLKKIGEWLKFPVLLLRIGLDVLMLRGRPWR